MRSFERSLAALGAACWALVILHLMRLVPLAGAVPLGLYGLYGFAAAAGWLAGNVYVHRRAGRPRPLARRLLVVYLAGPPALVVLLRAMAPAAQQAAAPLVPLYACCVYAIFFAVPVSLAPASTSPR